MDIFSHGLWTGVAAAVANRKLRKPISIRWAVWWGLFPDLFAFTIPALAIVWMVLTGHRASSDLPRPIASEPPIQNHPGLIQFATPLYNISHSLIVFAAVFAAVWLIRKRPAWELLGWGLHILVDIPTHSYRFFPTPFLWPFSSVKLNGISWGTPWFLAVNYFALAGTYLALYVAKRKRVAKHS